MKITVLGSGTSTGVPVPGCNCQICLSTDPRNNRLRSSILITFNKSDSSAYTFSEPIFNLLIDTTTDFRTQALQYRITQVNAVLYTHAHADHINGIDDLRSYNFSSNAPIPIYASAYTSERLRHSFSYVFDPDPTYEGGMLPLLELQTIYPLQPLNLFGIKIIPLTLAHGKMEVLGFRIGNFAYLTDCSSIPDESANALLGLDLLILDGLRERSHRTHFSFSQACNEISKLLPKKSYLIHMSHEVEHAQTNSLLKQLSPHNVELAYDGLTIDLQD